MSQHWFRPSVQPNLSTIGREASGQADMSISNRISVYTRCPLSPNDRSIRLVVIPPRLKHNDRIICTLEVERLGLNPQYEALSYCWGDPEVTEEIIVNSCPLQVTTNLASALRVLSKNGTGRKLWIDAICIDQLNNKEKEHQVPLMKEIYSKSVRVIIWLGNGDSTTHDGIFFLQKAAEKFQTEERVGFEGVRRANHPLRLLLRPGSLGFVLTQRRPPRPTKSPIHYYHSSIALLSRPWFRRVWVIQEVAVAKGAVVLCGEDTISWESLVNGVRLVEILTAPATTRYAYGDVRVPANFFFNVLQSTRADIQNGHYLNLRDALRRFQPFESTPPVDKIFALRGLLQQPEQLSIDYDSPVDRVYRDVAATIIQETSDMSLLLDCHLVTTGRMVPKLASWVPDWSANEQGMVAALTSVFARETFCATLGTNADFYFSSDGSVLRAYGFAVDKVSKLGQKRPSWTHFRESYWPRGSLFPKRDPYGFVIETCDCIRNWRRLAYLETSTDDARFYPTGETPHEVFWKTWLQPELISQYDRYRFNAWVRGLEWQFYVLDWFVHRIDRSRHWILIWSLFSAYLSCCSILAIFYILKGQVGLDKPQSIPDPYPLERTLGRTERGLLAFLPKGSQVGDFVILLRGVARPLILRSRGGCWRVIGSAYVHGIMYGGAFEAERCVIFGLV